MEAQVRQVLVKRGDQRVTTTTIYVASASQVAVERSCVDELRQGQLFGRCRAVVCLQLRARDIRHEVRGDDEPAETKGWRQYFAGGTDIYHAIGGQTLQGANRLAVVSILRVVVVFDDDGTLPRRPLEQRSATFGSEDRTRGVLMRRRDEHAPGIEPTKTIDTDAAIVDGNARGFQPARLDIGALIGVSRILDRDSAHPTLTKHTAQQPDALRRPVAEHHSVLSGDGRTGAVQVGRERPPGHRTAARIRIIERRIGQRGECAAQSGEPGAARKQRQVGDARPEIVPRGDRRHVLRRRLTVNRATAGNARRRALMRTQVAFGEQLLVRFHDNPPRHIDVGRKRSCRRQRRARFEPTGLDRAPQFALQLNPHRHTGISVNPDEERGGRSGPLHIGTSGPCECTTKLYSMPMMTNESTLPKVALATCRELPQLDADTRRLIVPLATCGVNATPAVWDDPDVDWARFDLVVVRSCWDYARRRREFLEWAARVPRLANPAPVLAWNTDKSYLSDLAARGIPVVPTEWLRPGQAWSLPERGAWVIKPAVSLASLDTGRYQLEDPGERRLAAEHVRRLHDDGRVVMMQPYLRAIDHEGETLLVYLNGVFSHAMRKAAVLTGPDIGVDRRFQPDGGLTLRRHRPTRRELAAAERVLDAVPWSRDRLLYARVDLISNGDADPILMELELTEPQLYFHDVPTATDRIAVIIEAHVRRRQGSGDRRRCSSARGGATVMSA
jgi:hypothetical protein